MAIDDLLNEHEQSERVRGWIRSNAIGIIGGVVLGLGAICRLAMVAGPAARRRRWA